MPTQSASRQRPPSRAIVRLLTRRVLAERRRLIAGLTIGGFLLALVTTSLFSSLGAEYDELFEEMPAALSSMLGDAQLGTIEGWLQAEVFSFMGPGLVIGAAIAVGSGALAGAEQSGRLGLISSGPVHRSTIVVAVVLAVVAATTITVGGLVLGIMAGAAMASISFSLGNVLAASLLVLLLGVTMGALAVAVGALTGHRGTSTSAAVIAAVASWAVFSFFPLSERLEPFAKVSFWHPYAAGRPLVDGLSWAHVAIFFLAIGLAVTLAVVAFERRDLST